MDRPTIRQQRTREVQSFKKPFMLPVIDASCGQCGLSHIAVYIEPAGCNVCQRRTSAKTASQAIEFNCLTNRLAPLGRTSRLSRGGGPQSPERSPLDFPFGYVIRPPKHRRGNRCPAVHGHHFPAPRRTRFQARPPPKTGRINAGIEPFRFDPGSPPAPE